MAQVTIHEAKTHLSQLIQRALAGEEIIIARGKEPVVKLVAITKPKRQRRLGGAKDVILYIADDFDAPLKSLRNTWNETASRYACLPLARLGTQAE